MTPCRFSFLMSYSHPQCHVDVIYDSAVRFEAPCSGVSIGSVRSVALTRLADYLAATDTPIDYQRRRQIDYRGLLPTRRTQCHRR